MNNTMTRLHINVSGKQAKSLEALKKKTGLTVSEHLRRAIDVYLASLESKGSKEVA